MSSNLIPSVNGISPKEGTPGTKLTIRGENLGSSASDILHVWMNKYDVSCTVQWHSTKKLNILSSLGEGIIKIIVETKSGGIGSCDVEYFQTVSQNVGLQDQVSYWPPNEQKQYQALSSYNKRTQPKQIQSEMMEDIKDIMHGNQSTPIGFALSDDDLSKIYKGRGSTSLTEPDFNPILFLLKFHHGTCYSDLVQLLEHYQTALANEKVKEPISIVKANLFTIFQCLECLEALKKKIDEEKANVRPMSGAFAENELCRTLEDSKNIAHQMYEEVLKRRDYADSARSALSVMQRFRFLFNLPHSIRDNILKGEYSTVINEYLRARSLFGSSEIRLFQQVYNNVLDVIDKFKDILRRQLLEMPNKCDAVKITIRLMRQLEVEYDPTWLCLENQRQWILQSISKLNTASYANTAAYKPRLDKSSPNSRKYPVVLMVEELDKILCERVFEAWSLACYYLELGAHPGAKEEGAEQPMEEERLLKVEELMMSMISAYASKVRDTLVQGSLQPGWLVYCVQHVRQAIEALSLDELPRKSTSILVGLLEELRVRAVRALLLHAEQDVVALAYKENWTAEISDEVGAMTRLPALYRNIMVTCFSELHRVMTTRHVMEQTVCSTPADEAAFIDWVSSAIKAYIPCADNILEKLKTKAQESVDPEQCADQASSSSINMSQYLLLMANNCHQVISVVVPSLIDNMSVQALPGTEWVGGKVLPPMEVLHNRLVDVYIELRLQGVLGPIEAAMGATGYNWREVPPATGTLVCVCVRVCVSMCVGARGYIHELILALAQAHSELELVCPHMSRECLMRVAARAVEEIHRVVEASDRTTWSRRGHIQLSVDLATLDSVLASLAPDLGAPAVQESWREAVSIMNVMRGGGVRLSSEEQLMVRQAVDGGARSLAMVTKGFRETGQCRGGLRP